MQITLFGAIWIVAVIVCFFSNDSKRILYITMLSMIFQSNNVLVLGETGIGTQVFTACAACIRLLLVSREEGSLRRVSGPLLRAVTVLYVALILSLIVNGNSGGPQMIRLLMLAVYLLMAWLIATKSIRLTREELRKIEDTIIIVLLVVGALQVLCKLGILPITSLLRTFIYNDTSNSDVIFNYKSTYRFYSTLMEPSYCGAMLVGAFALVVNRAQQKNDKKNITLAVLLAIAILLTHSSTAYGGLAIMACIMLFTKANNSLYKYWLPLFIAGGIMVCIFNWEVLEEVIFNKTETSSYRVRTNLNNAAIKAFEGNPLFGAGYQSLRASSLFYSLLGETGLLGVVPYLIMAVDCLCRCLSKRYGQVVMGANMMLLGIVICQFIACPDLTFSPFWLAIYICILAAKIENISPKVEGDVQ